jgi:magnesium transporter
VKKIKLLPKPDLGFLKAFNIGQGLAPGELVFIGERKQRQTRFTARVYSEDSFEEKVISSVSEIPEVIPGQTKLWLNVDGLHDIKLIREIGGVYGVHELVLEDILNTDQRAKTEISEDYIFTILKMVHYNQQIDEADVDQFSMILMADIVITFQERHSELLQPVVERLTTRKKRVREAGVDFLAYSLLDAIVEEYLSVGAYIESRVDRLEEDVLKHRQKDILERINYNQIELNVIRKSIKPCKETLHKLAIYEGDLISEKTQPYLKDLEELGERALDAVVNNKNAIAELLNVYSTHVNNKLNDVMKVLTIFSAVFIPLTFIAGIYGTNFEYIPQLGFRYSFYIMLAAMFVIVVTMIYYFKRKNWF